MIEMTTNASFCSEVNFICFASDPLKTTRVRGGGSPEIQCPVVGLLDEELTLVPLMKPAQPTTFQAHREPIADIVEWNEEDCWEL